jgi:hypothetical protein
MIAAGSRSACSMEEASVSSRICSAAVIQRLVSETVAFAAPGLIGLAVRARRPPELRRGPKSSSFSKDQFRSLAQGPRNRGRRFSV